MASIPNPTNLDNIYSKPTKAICTDEGKKLATLLENNIPSEPIDITSPAKLSPIQRLVRLSLLAYSQVEKELENPTADLKISGLIKAHSDLLQAIQDLTDSETAHNEKLSSLIPISLAQPVYEKLYTKVQSKLEILPARFSTMFAYKDAKFIREGMDKEIAAVFEEFRADLTEVIQGIKQSQMNLVTSTLDIQENLDDEGNKKKVRMTD